MRRTRFKGERSIIPDEDNDSRDGKKWTELRSPFRRGLGRIEATLQAWLVILLDQNKKNAIYLAVKQRWKPLKY